MTSLPDVTGDRRRSRRVEAALVKVPVVLRTRPLPAVLRDISAFGFAIETPQPVEVGESHRFELRFPSSRIEVAATCRHCSPNPCRSLPTFVAGFAFDALEGRAREVVMAFIDQVPELAAMEQVANEQREPDERLMPRRATADDRGTAERSGASAEQKPQAEQPLTSFPSIMDDRFSWESARTDQGQKPQAEQPLASVRSAPDERSSSEYLRAVADRQTLSPSERLPTAAGRENLNPDAAPASADVGDAEKLIAAAHAEARKQLTVALNEGRRAAIRRLDAALSEAAKANEVLAKLDAEVEATLGPSAGRFSWHELGSQRPGQDTRLAAWQRSCREHGLLDVPRAETARRG